MSGRIYASAEALAVRPNGTRQIHIAFRNMPPCPLRYELDPRDGVVSEDGLYTASDKKGVHVIRVLCAHDPLISTFADVHVRE